MKCCNFVSPTTYERCNKPAKVITDETKRSYCEQHVPSYTKVWELK